MTKKMQFFGLFICTQSALRVSGDVFAHHQEHLTVFTASDSQHRWAISEAVNTIKCSWWWAETSPETSPETCRADWIQINKPQICILLVINYELSLILRRSRTGTVWFYTSTSNKRAARPKLYTKSLTTDLKRIYSRFKLVRISINL